MKPTKANVERAAKRLDVEFICDDFNITIEAPTGYHFAGEVCGYHYCTFPADGYMYKRPEIYEMMLEQLSEGIEKCEPGCECLWDCPEEWDEKND